MKKSIFILVGALAFMSCKKDTAPKPSEPTPAPAPAPSTPADAMTPVNPVDINQEGLGFLEKIQGLWIGEQSVVGLDFPYMPWDFRAISESHVHGIYEGGTAGNLLTSFFVTDYKGKRTIMSRNGGDLNGIYRSSYFVLDSVNHSNGDWYRFVDAFGGRGIMSMELRFVNDSLYFNAYTSRFGGILPASLHATFKGQLADLTLAQTAATATGYPQNVVARDFSNGFNESDMWVILNESEPFSATFLEYNKDPWKIVDHPYIAYFDVNVTRHSAIQDKELLVYLSTLPITDANGIFDWNNMVSIVKIPSLIAPDNTLEFTYLHPGDYYVTVIADMDGDIGPSAGDLSSVSQQVTINPNGIQSVNITNIDNQN